MEAWKTSLRIGGSIAGAILAALSIYIYFEPEQGLKILWQLVVPLAPVIFFLAPNLWMSLCPFAFFQSIPQLLGMGGKRVIPTHINKWLEYTGWVLLFVLVPLRPVVFNQIGPAAIIAIAGISLAALISGFLFSGMSGWCNSICPVRPVELLYGQFSKYPENPAQCMPCSGCVQKCARLQNSNWTKDLKHAHFSYTFPGFVWGYFLGAAHSSVIETYAIVFGAMAISYLIFLLLARFLSVTTSLKTSALSSLIIYYSYILFYSSRDWQLSLPYRITLYAVVGLLLGGGFLLSLYRPLKASQSDPSGRRSFLHAGLAGFAALLGTSPWALAKLGRKTQDHLIKLGNKAKYNGAVAYTLGARSDRTSILTELHLDTGLTRTLLLPIYEGHSTLVTPAGMLACIGHHSPDMAVVDNNMRFVKKIKAPKGHTFGGHGVVLEDGRTIISTPVAKAMTPQDYGLLQVYDEHMNLVDEVNSGGVQPHEVHFVNNRKEIAVTHYGELAAEREGWPYTINVMEPKLTILDSKTLKPVRDYFSKVDWAILSHFDVGLDGKVYAVSNNYWHSTKRNISTYQDLTHEFGDNNYELVSPEFRGGIAMPLPLLVIDPLTGDQKEVMMPSREQRRSQSVRTNQHNGYVFATYVYSNSLVVFPPGKEPFSFDCGKWDIEMVRGIDQIKGTPYMVLSGTRNRIVVFNSENMELIQSHNIMYGRALHLDVNPNPFYS